MLHIVKKKSSFQDREGSSFFSNNLHCVREGGFFLSLSISCAEENNAGKRWEGNNIHLAFEYNDSVMFLAEKVNGE